MPGDGKVTLTWDDFADTKTREPLLHNENDFEGYKLYRSTDKYMSDAQIITDGQGSPKFRAPIFQCDKVDTVKGYCTFGGSQDGHLVYLGDDTGVKHYFVDTDVQNGRTYYYALVSYDYGIEDLNVSPAESPVDIELDESENVVRIGQNIQIVTPRQAAAGYEPPDITIETERSTERLTNGAVSVSIVDKTQIQPGHSYKLTFSCDTSNYAMTNATYRSIRDGRLTTAGVKVYDITQKPHRVYLEDKTNASIMNNVKYDPDLEVWGFPTNASFVTDVFQGLQCKINIPFDTIYVDQSQTGWIQGDAPINVQIGEMAEFFAYQYKIIFDPYQEYQSKSYMTSNIKDVDGSTVTKNQKLFGLKYPFYVINTLKTDSLGNPEKLGLFCYDANSNGVFDWDTDRIMVGYSIVYRDNDRWAGVIFSFDFIQAGSNENPTSPGDSYKITFERPFSSIDSLLFTVNPENDLEESNIKTTMDSIKVVPNPYIATNTMETAVANQYLNQRRRLLFTHIPADCVIKIFTPSGVLVDQIDVENEPSDGAVHWDMLSREGLEIAAGMYIFHVKSNVTGDEKIGKFAVIK